MCFNLKFCFKQSIALKVPHWITSAAFLVLLLYGTIGENTMERFQRYYNRRKNELQSEFKSSRAMYESACDTLIGYFHVSGADRLRGGDYTRLNPRLIFLVCDLTLYIVVNCWCLTVFWGQLTDVVFCLVTMGIAVQVRMKLKFYQ